MTGGFEKYAPGHILWLLGAVIGIALLCHVYGKSGSRGRKALTLCLAGGSLSIQLLRSALLMGRGLYGLSQLPLHLCSISVYLCFLYALHPKETLGQFLYAFSLPGWLLGLLFPGWGVYPLGDMLCILSFLVHILPAGFVIMKLCAGELRADIKLLPRVCALMLALAVPIYIMNISTGQNFMFLNYPPEGTPLSLFAFLGRPGYLLGVLPMAAVIWLMMYGCFGRG